MLELRVGNSKHFVTRWNGNRLPTNAKRYGRQWFGSNQQQYHDSTARSIVAYYKDQIVGFFRFNVEKVSGRIRLIADGTWVEPSFRRTGLARRMWERAFQKYSIECVMVVVTTKAGLRFVENLQSRHQGVTFWVTENL